jgi:hypothetical protein
VLEETTHMQAQHAHSAFAEAAATRWRQSHPDDDIDHAPPSVVGEYEQGVPNRHSASAEAAALKWREYHFDEDF